MTQLEFEFARGDRSLGLFTDPSLPLTEVDPDGDFELIFHDIASPTDDETISAGDSLYSKTELYALFRELYRRFQSKEPVPNNTHEANLFGYMETFGIGNTPKHLTTEIVRPWPGEDSSNVILMHGVFNGIPTPGWVEAFCLVKKKYPWMKFVVGIGSNLEIEEVKHQVPEGSTRFRASMLAHTGLVDGIFQIPHSVYIHLGYKYPPSHVLDQPGAKYGWYYDHWEGVYGKHKNPVGVLVVNGLEERARKERFVSPKTNFFDLSEQDRIFADFHSSKTKRWHKNSMEHVTDCWEVVREMLDQG